jgi:hypothetical protein
MSNEIYFPNELKEHSPINPKIGIKPSMPKIDELIIFLILLWKINNEKSEISYSEQVNDSIKIKDSVLDNILSFFNDESLNFFTDSDSTEIILELFSKSDIEDILNNNPLFTTQYEPLFVTLCLYFKLAKIEFIDLSNAQKERSGNKRYSKKILFTTNMDLISFIIDSDIKNFKALCFNILLKKDIKIDGDFYYKLKKMLLVFSESTLFKLRHDGIETIFNQEGIYSLLVENKIVSASDDKEFVGPMRILNTSILKKLHPFIDKADEKFKIKDDINIDTLKEYSKRVNNFLEICPVKYILTTSHSTTTPSESTEPHEYGSYKYKNVLLKGVPGTGKSHKIDYIIENELKIIHSKNKLRINIHAASSNSDLLQGIGINSDENGNIVYLEKQGIILKFIITAIMNPNEPFALVLEEIQENSLNELIGDLIYLLEETKRTDVKALIEELGLILEDFNDYQELLDEIISRKPKINYVQIPYLIESEPKFRNFILPTNLYLFFTSNYRDDKKVIEDNLLRRIATFEIFPKYKDKLGDEFKNKEVSDFLKDLNDSIINQFKDREVHPDRFLIGHANWLNVKNSESFYESLLKVIIEFQDIKELYFSDVNEILKSIENYPSFLESDIDNKIKEAKTYFDIIELLQDKIF